MRGWHEPHQDLDVLIYGRANRPGLANDGFRCIQFPGGLDGLDERIDRLAQFVERLHVEQPDVFPIALVGYSLGGLVTRGYLRRYPADAQRISHAIQIGTPNWGLNLLVVPQLAALAGLPSRSLRDLDLNSDFMRWLNESAGRWRSTRPFRRWRLDRAPVLGPAGPRLLAIAGRVPPFGDGDGLVSVDSATLAGQLPSVIIDGPHANHLNLIGQFNLAARLLRGFIADDSVWPRVVTEIASFLNE